MLQKTHAVHSLQQGCVRLGLPSSTAVALLQFLSAKRTHDQFVPEKDRQLHMSPGYSLHRLWHYMLLNTTGILVTWCHGHSEDCLGAVQMFKMWLQVVKPDREVQSSVFVQQ
jgi:hypothetical protein